MSDLKAYLRWHVAPRIGGSAAEGVRRRRLRLLQPDAGRPAGAAAALAPLRHPDRRAARRGARQGVRRRNLQPEGEGRHAADGAGHQERDAPGHRRRAVDERRNEEGGDGQARGGRRSHRLSRTSGATTPRIRVTRDDALGNRQRALRSNRKRDAGEDRPAGRSRRVEHDAADGQRLLQPRSQQHQLPRRHPAAAVLRSRTRRRGELRRRPARSSATS